MAYDGLPPRLERPANGIGWTPDRFRLRIWYPNCGISGEPADDGNTYTWEQATEVARRRIEAAGDPVFSVTFETVDPLKELIGEAVNRDG